jgi:2-amino-4-hydroxy-6-hydroxymethyldihydropteridine diphosphokinase
MSHIWTEVYMGLGSNIGERERYLREAVQWIGQQPDIRNLRSSSLYETKPVGYTEQADFLNAVVSFSTSKTAFECLDLIQMIENELGRKRIIHWGPRTIDIDLLLYGNAIINSDRLIVPHPRILERAFVIIPMVELNPNLQIPNRGLLREVIQDFHGKVGMRLWKTKHWVTESGLTGN